MPLDKFREDETTMRELPTLIDTIAEEDDHRRQLRSLYVACELRYDIDQDGPRISTSEVVSIVKDRIQHDLEHDFMIGLDNDLEAPFVQWFLAHNKSIEQRVAMLDQDFDQSKLTTVDQEQREILHAYMNELNEIKQKLIESIRKGLL